MKIESLRIKEGPKKRNPDVLPEWDNSENYCISCNFRHNPKASFRLHCKVKHYIKPPTIERPDWHDPNFYCKTCNITYNGKSSHLNHYRYFHPTKLKPKIANPDLLPDELDSNNYCKTCNRSYIHKGSYRTHLRYIHRMLGVLSF